LSASDDPVLGSPGARGMLSGLFREGTNRIVSEEISPDEGIRRMENAVNQLRFSGGAAR